MTQATPAAPASPPSRYWRDYRFLGFTGTAYMLLDSVGDAVWLKGIVSGLALLFVTGFAYDDRRARKQAEAAQ